MERHVVELESGRKLHHLHNGEDVSFGFFEVLPSGQARIWRETWHDRYRLEGTTFPGPVSAMRALKRGEV